MNFTLKLTDQEVELIGAALNELPRKISNDLFVKISQQCVEQREAQKVTEDTKT